MVSEQTKNESGSPGNEGGRVVLLITTPMGRSFELIANVTGFRAPQTTPIDWSSHDNSSLPDLASRFRFTTHYALCVIDCKIWESTSVSLLQKFRGAKFWDHPGDYTTMMPSRSSRKSSSAMPVWMNACTTWSEEGIRDIDSGEVIGRTDMSDEEITRNYTNLRQDWTYMPVYWNCHDLAIRLTYIIVEPSLEVIMTLKKLMISLRQAYHREINWNSTAGQVCLGGWTAVALGDFVSLPPLAIAGAGVFMVGWSIGFFEGLAVSSKEKARCQFMIKLEEKFPQLNLLHN